MDFFHENSTVVLHDLRLVELQVQRLTKVILGSLTAGANAPAFVQGPTAIGTVFHLGSRIML